jgi:hypothetical protein
MQVAYLLGLWTVTNLSICKFDFLLRSFKWLFYFEF